MSNGTINLRRATLDDVSIYLEVEKTAAGSKTYSAMSNKNEVAESITNNFAYFIESNGEVVGDYSYSMKSPNHAYLGGPVVLPEFQGQGIARKATEIILGTLKGVELIDLVTHPENEKAIKLYESFGFKKTDEVLENYFGDGQPRIRMVLQK